MGHHFRLNEFHAFVVVDALIGTTAVTRLQIDVSQLSILIARNFATFISTNPSFHHLVLGGISASSDIAVTDCLLDAAANNGTMRQLSCSDYNVISSASCLEKNHAYLEELTMILKDNDDQGIQIITSERSNEALILEAAYRSLSKLQALRIVCLTSSTVAPIFFAMVDHPTLNKVDIQVRGQLEGAGFAQTLKRLICSSTPLQKLKCTFVADDHGNVPQGVLEAIVPELSEHKSLRHLNFRWRGDLNLIHAAQAATDIDTLFLSLHKMLCINTCLESMILDCPCFTECAILLEALMVNSTLQHLSVQFKMLCINTCLESMILDCPCFTECAILLEALMVNSTLRHLSVQFQMDGFEMSIGQEGFQQFANALPMVPHLKVLHLELPYGTKYSMSFRTSLWKAFQFNRTLTGSRVVSGSIIVSGTVINDMVVKDTLDFYNCRNSFSALLASAAYMVTFFPGIPDSNAGLSVIFDTLRNRHDWFQELRH